ncbi:MFS transporter, FSR family, fosmidomycin resistance protein [Sinomicrobium oceani]|uniref:MFS transporter, FSR family, fosmidomycin resistance protein n=1 Tax=Sinomicrobium oceani TaxID=1150368 RepID=A0A1K1LRQ7_9FLAO|nr:MFS transporter [Sinomicrobium oceani]SFW12326.1 MFS transporter, FSR family, fosmidomycin resistance protein [Sinomicrobium oceani]
MHKNTSVSAGSGVSAEKTVFPVLFALSFSHMMNDTLQSLIPSIYPLVKETFKLSFAQVGLITLTFQLTASLLQPLVGLYTDKYPKPYSLAIGMGFTLIGLVVLSMAPNFGTILLAVGLIGMGSSVFHPEASRIAHMASGGRHGMAQSLFQVGGNAGSSMGPLLAAMIIVPFGQSSVIWFSLAALLAIIVLSRVGQWYKNNLYRAPAQKKKTYDHALGHRLSRTQVIWSIVVLLFLIFSKYIYMSSLTSYYTFYLMDKFDVSVQASQVYLFVFLFAIAAGTFFGGPLGDRFGRKYVIWFSILGIAPFTLILPYVNLFWTGTLTVLIGLILSSAFSAILVYAQELIPGKVGMVSGLFFGFAFGIAGIGSAVLGDIADATSIEYVFKMCSFLPLLGLLTVFLPSEKRKRVDV